MKYTLLFFIFSFSVHAQFSEVELSGETRIGWDKGSSVDIEDNIAVVGVPAGVLNDVNSGFVYVYEQRDEQWELVSTLSSDLVLGSGRFGLHVDVSEGRIFVTADQAGRMVNGEVFRHSGMVFVFEKINNEWVQTSELIPSVIEEEDHFGIQLTADGDRVFVSKGDFDELEGTSSGGVFVFELTDDGWVENHLIVETEISGDFNTLGFYKVEVEGDTLLVPNVINVGNNTLPEIYVYRQINDQWEIEQIIEAPQNISLRGNFGFSMSVFGDSLLISAPFYNRVGRVYLYERENRAWSLSQVFESDTSSNQFQNFGYDVLMSDNQLFIGASIGRTVDLVNDEGNVVIYNLVDGDWQLSNEVEAEGEQGLNYFGAAISLSDGKLIVGAPRADVSGAAYVYTIEPNSQRLFINAGLNGTWFNQKTSGQGLFLDVNPATDFSFLGWFTYDTQFSPDDALGQIGADGQRWLVGAGDIDQANSSIHYNLYYAYDGLFDDPRETMASSTETYGDLTITFASCTTAMVSYQLFEQGISGSYPVSRPVAASGDLCSEFATGVLARKQPVDNFDYSLNGAWFNQETPGQGFFIDKFKGVETAFLGWFTFDNTIPSAPLTSVVGATGQRWLVGQGAIDLTDPNVLNYQLYYTYGGLFDDPVDVKVVEPGTYGDLRIEFTDCANANVEYSIDGEGLSGSFAMIRAVPNGCELTQQ